MFTFVGIQTTLYSQKGSKFSLYENNIKLTTMSGSQFEYLDPNVKKMWLHLKINTCRYFQQSLTLLSEFQVVSAESLMLSLLNTYYHGIWSWYFQFSWLKFSYCEEICGYTFIWFLWSGPITLGSKYEYFQVFQYIITTIFSQLGRKVSPFVFHSIEETHSVVILCQLQ